MVKQKNRLIEFFKPTVLKVILTLVILIFFVPIFKIDSGVRCVTEPCESQSNVSLLIYLLSMIEGTTLYKVFYLNILIGVITSYLVSCAAVIFVEFIKEKTKNMWLNKQKF